MKRSRLMAVSGFFLTALSSSPAWGSVPPQPGTVNYVEGQAAIDGSSLNEQSVGSTKLAAGQSLSTQNGRAEILLTPGIFLRVGDQSTVQMVSPGLADTVTNLTKGRAMVEVDQIRPENNVRVNVRGSSTQLLKPGLYDFRADLGLVRVFDGEAVVQAAGQSAKLGRDHQVSLNTPGKLKTRKFDAKASMDDFYRWASLRSSYLAEASVDAARSAVGAYGGGSGWYDYGWYWDPWFAAYTFVPGDGVFVGPFGWGFYSPWYALAAPYWGYGWRGGFYHHFGPGYRPPLAAHAGRPGFAGRAYSMRGGMGVSRGAFAGARGGFAGGGFHSGGGFHGGGGGRGR